MNWIMLPSGIVAPQEDYTRLKAEERERSRKREERLGALKAEERRIAEWGAAHPQELSVLGHAATRVGGFRCVQYRATVGTCALLLEHAYGDKWKLTVDDGGSVDTNYGYTAGYLAESEWCASAEEASEQVRQQLVAKRGLIDELLGDR